MSNGTPVSLSSCEYRVLTEQEATFFCRQSRVRTTSGLVTPAICSCCTLADVPCAEPRLLPSEQGGIRAAARSRLRHWDEQIRILSTDEQLNDCLTIAITAFQRPDSLKRLVRSIRQFYPHVLIIIADNGNQHCSFDDERVTCLELPFDCGLSASRNALARACETEFMLLLEDDFEFIPETKIETFVDILRHFPDVGVVGGALWLNGELLDFATDVHIHRGHLSAVRARGPYVATPSGSRFQYVDMIFNFGVFRRSMLHEHPWDERLKLCEHVDYFLTVRNAQKWRVGFCDLVRCLHHQDRNDEYDTYRLGERTKDYTQQVHRKHDLTSTSVPAARFLPNRRSESQNIILFGVGHSGTSVVSRMLMALGWNGGADDGDVDDEFAEHIEIRRLNDFALMHGVLPLQKAFDEVAALPAPWVIKDPRFVQTLHLWMPVFCEFEPALFWLVRDLDRVQESYRRRQGNNDADPVSRGRHISELFAMAERSFATWPWSKKRIDYESIRQAMTLFDPTRGDSCQSAIQES